MIPSMGVAGTNVMSSCKSPTLLVEYVITATDTNAGENICVQNFLIVLKTPDICGPITEIPQNEIDNSDFSTLGHSVTVLVAHDTVEVSHSELVFFLVFLMLLI